MGAAEEVDGPAFANDHDAGAAGLADGRAGVAGGVGAAGRAAGDSHEAAPAGLAAGGAVAAEGSVESGHALARTGHVEPPSAAAGAGGRAIPLELAEAAQAGGFPEQFVDEHGGAPGVGHQVGPSTRARHGDVEEAALLGVPERAAGRRRQHDVEQRIFLVLSRKAEAGVPKIEHDHVVGLAALGGMHRAELEAQPPAT